MFKKLAAMLVGAIMAAMPLAGSVMAADYTLGDFPAPFVEGNEANFLIVIGSGGTASGIAQDLAGLINVAVRLGGETVTTEGGGTVTVDGGKQVIAPGTDFTYGNDTYDILPTGLGESDFPVLLAKGTYDENEGVNKNDETYTQMIIFGDGAGVAVFDTDDNDENEPAGTYLYFPSGTKIYDYSLEFTNDITVACSGDEDADMATTKIEIMGKEYTVSDVTCDGSNYITKIVLLGGAVEQTVNDEETIAVTLGGKEYEITPSIYSADMVTLTVEYDGTVETTSSLDEGETEELADGTEIGIRDILFSTKESKTSAVTFYLGAQKLTLDEANDILVNDDEIEDYTTAVVFTPNTADKLGKITISVTPEEDAWIGVGSEWIDPVFGSWKIMFTGTVATTEEIKAEATGDSGKLIVYDVAGNKVEIPFVSYDSNDGEAYPGNDLIDTTYDVVVDGQAEGTANAGGNLLLANGDTCTGASSVTDCEGVLFLAVNSGGAARVIEIKDYDTTNHRIDFKDLTTGELWEDKAIATYDGSAANTVSLGSFMQIGLIVNESSNLINISQMNTFGGTGDFMTSLAGEVSITYDGVNSTVKLYSDDATELFDFTFKESSDEMAVTTSDANLAEEEDSDTYWGLDSQLWGALMEWDSENTDDVTITYPAEPTEMLVFVAPESAASTSTSSGVGRSGVIKSNVAVVDTDVTSTQKSNYHLILGGGPAVNKMTAEALGLTYPTYGADTGIPENGYMIKLVPDAFVEGNYALVIAGWEAEQTTEAMSKVQANMAGMTGDVYYYPAAPE